MNRSFIVFVLTGTFAAVTCHAGSRTSPSYSIPTESLDAGGQRVASPAYRMEGSLGEVGGLSSSTNGSVVAKSGYGGQLYDVTGFVIQMTPPQIDEGTSKQINAARTVDDGTLLALNPAQVVWSVQSGPLTVGRSGVAAAPLVYHDTGAQVQGAFESKTSTLALTIRNIAADNYGSYANDQIDDAWQVQYFGENNPAAGPLIDPDQDGQNNLFEYTAGVSPTNARSLFTLEISRVPGQPSQRNLTFSPRLPDRTYEAQYRLNLSTPWQPVPAIGTTDFRDERTITDLRAIEPNKLYRIQITKP